MAKTIIDNSIDMYIDICYNILSIIDLMRNVKIDYTTHLSHDKNFRQVFLILHYTAENFSNSVKTLTTGGVSAHYLVPTLKTIDPSYSNDELIAYNLVNEEERAWHAGVSHWSGRTNLNDSSIGIEIVNMASDSGFVPYPEEQTQVVIELCKNIIDRYNISPEHVLGHSDIAVGRKIDPGPLFPWHTLYQAGVGAWFNSSVVDSYIEKFTKEMPKDSEVIERLSHYGYNTNIDQKNLLAAFQMHFRPANYQGELDPETAAIAYALCDEWC